MIRGLLILSVCVSLVSPPQKALTSQTLPKSHGVHFQKNCQQTLVKYVIEEQSEESSESDIITPPAFYVLEFHKPEYLPHYNLSISGLSSWLLKELFLRGPPANQLNLA